MDIKKKKLLLLARSSADCLVGSFPTSDSRDRFIMENNGVLKKKSASEHVTEYEENRTNFFLKFYIFFFLFEIDD